MDSAAEAVSEEAAAVAAAPHADGKIKRHKKDLVRCKYKVFFYFINQINQVSLKLFFLKHLHLPAIRQD